MKLNPTSRKVYAPKGTKPIQLVNGSKQKVYLFAAVSNDKNHCCTDKKINADSFIKFVRSKKVKEFVKRNKDRLILWFLPKKLPELNPTEQGWKSARMNVTYKLFGDTKSLGWAVKSHIRRGFRINLSQFWG